MSEQIANVFADMQICETYTFAYIHVFYVWANSSCSSIACLVCLDPFLIQDPIPALQLFSCPCNCVARAPFVCGRTF